MVVSLRIFISTHRAYTRVCFSLICTKFVSHGFAEISRTIWQGGLEYLDSRFYAMYGFSLWVLNFSAWLNWHGSLRSGQGSCLAHTPRKRVSSSCSEQSNDLCVFLSKLAWRWYISMYVVGTRALSEGGKPYYLTCLLFVQYFASLLMFDDAALNASHVWRSAVHSSYTGNRCIQKHLRLSNSVCSQERRAQQSSAGPREFVPCLRLVWLCLVKRWAGWGFACCRSLIKTAPVCSTSATSWTCCSDWSPAWTAKTRATFGTWCRSRASNRRVCFRLRFHDSKVCRWARPIVALAFGLQDTDSARSLTIQIICHEHTMSLESELGYRFRDCYVYSLCVPLTRKHLNMWNALICWCSLWTPSPIKPAVDSLSWDFRWKSKKLFGNSLQHNVQHTRLLDPRLDAVGLMPHKGGVLPVVGELRVRVANQTLILGMLHLFSDVVVWSVCYHRNPNKLRDALVVKRMLSILSRFAPCRCPSAM